MLIRVRLFATLREYAPDHGSAGARFPIELPEGATLGDLVRMLKLPEDLVKVTFVNGLIKAQDTCLQPEDEVGIFPPIGGGAS